MKGYSFFKPGSDGWHVEVDSSAFAPTTTVIVARRSPWCAEHLEGLSDNMYPLNDRPAEDYVANLKQQIELSSARRGCCMTCHPDAARLAP